MTTKNIKKQNKSNRVKPPELSKEIDNQTPSMETLATIQNMINNPKQTLL
jgi:hypothetical protein